MATLCELCALCARNGACKLPSAEEQREALAAVPDADLQASEVPVRNRSKAKPNYRPIFRLLSPQERTERLTQLDSEIAILRRACTVGSNQKPQGSRPSFFGRLFGH